MMDGGSHVSDILINICTQPWKRHTCAHDEAFYHPTHAAQTVSPLIYGLHGILSVNRPALGHRLLSTFFSVYLQQLLLPY